MKKNYFRLLTNEVNYDPSFKLDFRGAVTMKGKSEPMNCWFLTRSMVADTLISDVDTDV